jgi:aspartate racemase
MRTVGILGGMGPQATILLMQKVLSAVPAHDDRDHVPLIVDQNPQVPSRIEALIEGTGESPTPALIAMARRLETAGCRALAMPCNTAHHYAEEIKAAVTIPFLDMIVATAKALSLQVPPGGRIGILASPAVRKSQLYEPALTRQGFQVVYPDDDSNLLNIIRAVKRGETRQTGKYLAHEATKLSQKHGCCHLLVSCTELSLLTDVIPSPLSWTDSLDVLVQEIVQFSSHGSQA